MSIFISELAFVSDAVIDQAKVGIIVASVAAGILGAIVLNFALPKSAAVEVDQRYAAEDADSGPELSR
jgi:Na+/H+ antiporter NhaA